MQEFRANAIVHPDSARHVLYVGTDFFAQISNFIDR
jgi:hypothetical protein